MHDRSPVPKADLLRRWDESTRAIDAHWATIPAERFGEHMVAFGQFPGPASLGISIGFLVVSGLTAAFLLRRLEKNLIFWL